MHCIAGLSPALTLARPPRSIAVSHLYAQVSTNITSHYHHATTSHQRRRLFDPFDPFAAIFAGLMARIGLVAVACELVTILIFGGGA